MVLPAPGAKPEPALTIGGLGDHFRLPCWNRSGRLLAAEDSAHQRLVLASLTGERAVLTPSRDYRGQRFMEIYNFDLK